MTTDDIKKMTIYMMDKDGNGYIGPVPEEVFSIVAEFVKFAKVNTCQFEMVGIENFVTTDRSK